MKINRAYKVELDPNNKQATALLSHCGAARFVYNWGLEQKIKAFEKREKIPTAMTLAKQLRAEREEVAPWLTAYSSYVIDSTLPHCDAAFDNFFRRCKEGKKGKKGFPRFKSRKRGIGSMRFHKAYVVESGRIRLPRIGWINLKEHNYIPTEGVKYFSATVSAKAGRWYVSVGVEYEAPEPQKNVDTVVSVHFGVRVLATCSDGTTYENPKSYKRGLRKLRRLQRSVSRKQSGSNNRAKAIMRVAKHHKRIADIRANNLHVTSSHITRKSSVIIIEDWDVKQMLQDKWYAQSVSDASLGELRRQIEYKSGWRGNHVVTAERYFASSKTCNICGAINDKLVPSMLKWVCVCGVTHDREQNAVANLLKHTCHSSGDDGVKPSVSRRPKRKLAGTASDNSNACGGESSGLQSIASETIPCEAGTQQ